LAPPQFVRAVSYGVYQGRMREAIHALKYDRLHPASTGLGRMLAAAIAQLSGVAPPEMLVIPVPLHPSKYAQRGFNQSRSLATQALAFLRKSHPQWRLTLASSTLLRQRATDSQAGLTPRQRRLNVRGAFQVSDAARVKGQHVLIVDDILTTGATARAAARALVEAGAASVWVATLARAQRVTGFGSTSVHEYMQEEEPLAGASAAGFGSTNLGTADFDAESFSTANFSATSFSKTNFIPTYFSKTNFITNGRALHGQPSF
jgi:ComF family protein